MVGVKVKQYVWIRSQKSRLHKVVRTVINASTCIFILSGSNNFDHLVKNVTRTMEFVKINVNIQAFLQ